MNVEAVRPYAPPARSDIEVFATSRCIEVDEGIEMSLLEERRWVEVVEVVELVLVDDLLLLVGITDPE